MANTIDFYREQILTRYATERQTAGLAVDNPASWSRVSIKRLWVYVIAFLASVQATLWDAFKAKVQGIIDLLKPHSLRWYASKAKAFQYGHSLVAEQDYYDNSGQTDQQIEASRIIQQVAVVEQERGLRMKVATAAGTDLGPLSAPQLAAFRAYMAQVKDAGVKLDITSGQADGLKLSLAIYYNPQVLNSDGARLDGTGSDPVGTAVRAYLKTLPFNGVFLLQSLVDVLQAVPGVTIANPTSAQAQYGNLPYTAFTVMYVPDAGYLRLVQPTDLTITYLPYSE